MTGGKRESRYARNISESNTTAGSAGAVSWFVPLVVRAGGGEASISTRKVIESGVDFIDALLGFGGSLPQRLASRLEGVLR
jgi:hypothetical protein